MARARRKPARDAVQAPTGERWARGEVERLESAIADEAGRPARPFRAPDTILVMQRRGSITPPMRQAAEDFRALFHLAALDPLRATDLSRLPDRGGAPAAPGQRQVEARAKVWSAMRALGGIASPGGSCIWHVVGAEWTLKDWALREGWGGRPLSPETAAGILIGGLGVLQALYGL